MKLLTKKDIAGIIKKAKLDVFKNISKNTPKEGNAIDKIIAEQLERFGTDIQKWRNSVDEAEDIINPDRQELMEQYKDFIDDYQLFATMQSRINKAISGTFKIMDKEGEIDEQEQAKFIDPQGYPHPWFRDFMTYIMLSKFYGFEAIQLGDVVNDTFDCVEKIPEENVIPYYDAMIKDVNQTYIQNGDNTINFFDPEYDTWVVRCGSKTDLGLINKCAPYIIYKKVFGDWVQHASIFGMPYRVGTTNMTDNNSKQNMINAFVEQEGSSFLIKDHQDEVELLQASGSDPFKIYEALIDKCDSAISKIVLSQTGTTDEKAYSGSAGVHADTESDLIQSDKLDIKTAVNKELIPRMKKIGMISESKELFGGWDHSEKLSIQDWSDVISKISAAGFAVDPEEVEKHTTLEVDPNIVAMPEQNTFSIMNKINKLYGKDNS